jgi:hypothetical protein
LITGKNRDCPINYRKYLTNHHSIFIIDSLELTDNKFEEFQGLPERRTSNDNIKHNSSNDEDEVLELTALDDFDTGNQDDDDLATLNDLAWELESSTGRLTRCEDDLHLER